jgi:RNA polymerase sigma factor (sigma-70 family)
MRPIEIYLIENRNHLYKQAMKLVKSKDLANDMIQDLSVIILSDFKYSGDFDSKKMNTYCWGIMLNKTRNHFNDRKKWVMEELDTNMELGWNRQSTPNPISTDFNRTFYEWELENFGFDEPTIKKLSNIKFNLRDLEPYELNLYKMYFEDGLSLTKISKRCNLPKSTIWNHWRGLLSKLEEYSKKDGGLQY